MFSRLKTFSPEVWSWMTYDFANSAFATTITAVIFNKYFAGVIAGGAAGTDFSLFGWQFNLPGATLFALAVLFGTVLTIILSPFVGIYADRRGVRKRLLIWTIFIGSISTAALSWLEPGNVISGAIFYGIASCAFILSCNLYNAFLPQICPEKDVGFGFRHLLGDWLRRRRPVSLAESGDAAESAGARFCSRGVWRRPCGVIGIGLVGGLFAADHLRIEGAAAE